MGYIHPTQSSKSACRISLGTTFSAEMSPRNGLESAIRSGRPLAVRLEKMSEPVESKEEPKEELCVESGSRQQ